MLKVLAVAVCVVASTLAYKCCTPGQYEGKVLIETASGAGGSAAVTQEGAKFAYDRQRRMEALWTSETKGRISDYNTAKTVAFDYATKTCEIVPETARDIGCIPDNAKVVSHFLPFSGSHSTIYSYNMNGMNIIAQMTEDSCLPIMSSFYSNNITSAQDAGVTGFTMGNITLGIEDSAIFQLPDFCTPQVKAEAHTDLCCSYENAYELEILQEVVVNAGPGKPPSVTGMTVTYSLNKTMMREAVQSQMGFGVINDLASRKEYVIQPDGTCTSRDVDFDKRGCLPSSAVKIGDMVNGLGAQTRIYKYKLDGRDAVTQLGDGCVPYLTSIRSSDLNKPGSEIITQLVGAYTSGIKDQSVFNIPAACNPTY